MNEILNQMRKKAKNCAEEIKKHKQILIVSHIDADGLTSAGIISTALDRINIENSTRFIKQLNGEIIEELKTENHELIIFTDLGSGMLESINAQNLNAIISDHHQPRGEFENHLNPHLFGANGSFELSGSGTTYILASQLGDNHDLADLAIVGAIGDLQHMKKGKLCGINQEILNEGVLSKVLHFKKDIMFFGKQTRPLYKLLQYSSDPYLPGLAGNEVACIGFLKNIGIRYSSDERWRRWIDLEQNEKQKIVSALFQYCMKINLPSYKIDRMIGEVYTLLKEKEGTEMRDASEYSTLLNATARYGHADIGFLVCKGDRGDAYDKAKKLLGEHRKNLINGLSFVKENGIIELKHLQYFDAGSKINETIIGIIAGMSTTLLANKNLPIIAFADADGGTKVSARGTQDLIRKGLNLSDALSIISKEVGGAGGGHDIAAGAIIPCNTKDEFIRRLDAAIGVQIGVK